MPLYVERLTAFRSDVDTLWTHDLYDLYDLYDLHDSAHVGRREPYNLHDLEHVSCVGCVLQYTDRAQPLS